MTTKDATDVAETVAQHLPYLRRYARALTGSQSGGDQYAIATLEAVVADPRMVDEAPDARVALFGVFHGVWTSTGAPVAEPDTRLSAAAQAHLASLTPGSREALLLHSIEGFTLPQIATIMGGTADEAAEMIERALLEMQNSVAGKVMIIEDEAIIAMDLSAIVEELGHAVTGVARTRAEAVRLAASDTPDLILADIQLADNSSGIDAVNDILGQFDDLPVVFITAFPERLLTGTQPEPAFLINKPYTEEQVRSAVSQAMFFSSTETLKA